MKPSNSSRAPHLLRGEQAEQQAYKYLLKQGLLLVEKNFSCQYGEIDLIMQAPKTLVIVEVRFRQSNTFGGALESITHKKQSRIMATTHYYLSVKKINPAIRFDVIAISSDTHINWIQNAF